MIAVDKGYAHTGPGSPERQLWCAVLDKVLDDLRGHLPSAPERPSRMYATHVNVHRTWSLAVSMWRNRHRETISARHFAFATPYRWRSIVCDLAGVNEECFMKAAQKRVPV